MNKKILEFVIHAVADRVGIAVQGKIVPDADGPFCEFIPADGHPNETFVVRFRIGWRSAEASFVAGKFAGPLIANMGKCSEEDRQTFSAFASGLAARRVKVNMGVNGIEVVASHPATWPPIWSLLDLSLKLTPIIVDPNVEAEIERLALDLVVPLFGMVVTLIGVEENELPTTGEPEGREMMSLTTRYERKKVNREACIQLKGSRCSVCGFDFAEVYGNLGIGYIEIHHTKSVASAGKDYRFNVAAELEPLCSNCHSMAHREDPPVSIERLRQLVKPRAQIKSG